MPLNMRFRFSPAKDGLVKVLGPLETDIMQIVWQDERSTVKKVHRKLSQQRDIAYTTVMTTMSRLAEKGVLNRHREGLGLRLQRRRSPRMISSPWWCSRCSMACWTTTARLRSTTWSITWPAATPASFAGVQRQALQARDRRVNR